MLKRKIKSKKKTSELLSDKIAEKSKIDGMKICQKWCEETAENLKEQLGLTMIQDLDYEIFDNVHLYYLSEGRGVGDKRPFKYLIISSFGMGQVRDITKVYNSKEVVLTFSSIIDKTTCKDITGSINRAKEIKFGSYTYNVLKAQIEKTLGAETINYIVSIFIAEGRGEEYSYLEDTLYTLKRNSGVFL